MLFSSAAIFLLKACMSSPCFAACSASAATWTLDASVRDSSRRASESAFAAFNAASDLAVIAAHSSTAVSRSSLARFRAAAPSDAVRASASRSARIRSMASLACCVLAVANAKAFSPALFSCTAASRSIFAVLSAAAAAAATRDSDSRASCAFWAFAVAVLSAFSMARRAWISFAAVA